jgi:hypothetical protein
MTTEQTSHVELPFRPDFASRVLEEADHAIAKRDRLAHMGVLAAVVAITGAFGLWSMVEPQAPQVAVPAIVATNTQTLSSAFAQSAQTEPLDYMFPGATSLAELSDQYATATTAGVTTRRNILFTGETSQDVE